MYGRSMVDRLTTTNIFTTHKKRKSSAVQIRENEA